jgi:hypothetical protein
LFRKYANLDEYEGEFVDSMRHGKGVFRFHNGDRYDGEFERNLFHGFGLYTWSDIILSGVNENAQKSNEDRPMSRNIQEQYENDMILLSGSGESVIGKRYEGEWKDGKMHGKGIYHVGNVDKRQEMSIRLKMKINKDKNATSNSTKIPYTGDIYTGCFANGRYEGKGTLKKSNGDLFVGEWFRGHPSGKMTITYANGDKVT